MLVRYSALLGRGVVICLGAPSATGRVPWCNPRKRRSANVAHSCNCGPRRNECVRGGETESAEPYHTPVCNRKTRRERNQPPEWSSRTCEPRRCCSRSWPNRPSRRNRPKPAWRPSRAKESGGMESYEWLACQWLAKLLQPIHVAVTDFPAAFVRARDRLCATPAP